MVTQAVKGGTLAIKNGTSRWGAGTIITPPTTTTPKLRIVKVSGTVTPGSVTTPPSTGHVWDGDPTIGIPSTVPLVNFTTLYRSGDSVDDALARLGSYAVVMFPDGFDGEFSDFSFASGQIGIFNRYLLGIGGSSPEQARIRIKPGSSTKAGSVPVQGGVDNASTNQLYMARFGQVGEGTSDATPADFRHNYLFGFTLEGTDQAIDVNSGNQPHNYNGILNYLTNGSIYQNLRLISPSYGHMGWPPGETFGINDYKGVGNIYRRIEVDGRNAAGISRGSSPLGGNNSTNITLEDCYFHDSLVSGLTWSFTGSVTNPAAVTNGVTTRRVKVEHNANKQIVAGKTFTGFNHENVVGPVRHYYPYIQVDNDSNWASNHMVFNNRISDNADIQIFEPTTVGGWAAYKGAFTVAFAVSWGGEANKQVTAPLVVKNGVTLSPYHVYSNPGSSPIAALNPATQYVIVHGGT